MFKALRPGPANPFRMPGTPPFKIRQQDCQSESNYLLNCESLPTPWIEYVTAYVSVPCYYPMSDSFLEQPDLNFDSIDLDLK